MPCYHPLKAWRSRTGGPPVFSEKDGWLDKPLNLPCGRCIGCKRDRARQWAVRCMHEADMHDMNSFLTLTYDEAHLPEDRSLDKTAFPKFMKRYRKYLGSRKIKSFYCGEYGEETGRPHYHAIIFGHEFGDIEHVEDTNGNNYYFSPALARLWPFGHHVIGSVTFDSCMYVAKYCIKSVNGDVRKERYTFVDEDTGEIFEVLPEFGHQSNGIGKEWFERFRTDVWSGKDDDFVVTSNGVPSKPPRYYFKKLQEWEDSQPFLVNSRGVVYRNAYSRDIKGRRNTAMRDAADDNTPARLAAKEAVALAEHNLKRREL